MAADVGGLTAGRDGLADGARELAVGVRELAVGAGRGPVVVVDGGEDSAGVFAAPVLLSVPFPPPVTPAMMTRRKNPSTIQLATCTARGSDRKRRQGPGPFLLLLNVGSPFPGGVRAPAPEQPWPTESDRAGHTAYLGKYPRCGNLTR